MSLVCPDPSRSLATLSLLVPQSCEPDMLMIRLGISLAQANTAGHTKKNVQYSILYIGYAVGRSILAQEMSATPD